MKGEGRVKTVHIEKRGDQKSVFSPKKNGPHQEFHSPVFNLPYCFSHYMLQAKPCKKKIVQFSFEAIPNFMKWYPLSLTFLGTLNLGIRKGLEAQTRVQTQGHYADNCNNNILCKKYLQDA